jgi:hypothetical protein
MPRNGKPRDRVAPAQGSEDAQASQAEYLQDSQSTRVPQALLSSAITVSDGRRVLGYIVEVTGSATAVISDGQTISTHRSRREAFRAISIAAAGRAALPSNSAP